VPRAQEPSCPSESDEGLDRDETSGECTRLRMSHRRDKPVHGLRAHQRKQEGTD